MAKMDAENALGQITMAQTAIDTRNQVASDETQRQTDIADARTLINEAVADASMVVTAIQEEAADGLGLNDQTTMDRLADAETAVTTAEDAKVAAEASDDLDMIRMYLTAAQDAVSDADTAKAAAIVASAAAKLAADEATETENVRVLEYRRAVARAFVEGRDRNIGSAVGTIDGLKSDADKANTDAAKAKSDAAEAMTRAKMGRTDHPAAKTAYETAKAKSDAVARAATKAAAAVPTAANARTEVRELLNAIDAATTIEELTTARGNAQVAWRAARDARDGLSTESVLNALVQDAQDAAKMAMYAANTHVLALFNLANATGVKDDPTTTTVDEQARAAGVAAAAVTASANVAGNGGGGITATWGADTRADPDDPAVEFKAGAFMITANPGTEGNPLDFSLEAIEADAENDTAAAPKTATKIDGVPGFMHGYEISSGRTHALVFTDIEQEEAEAAAKTIDLVITNRAVTASRITLSVGATDLAGATYDHDNDEDTNSVMATFACGSAQATDCSFEIVDGKLTSLVRYVVNVSVDDFILVAGKPVAPDNDYLAFGVWMNQAEGDDGAITAGAFAGGSADFGTPVPLTGSATYNGSAVGLYRSGSSTSYFQGNATLTAEFGDRPEDDATDTVAGTVTGMINNIVAGGDSMSDVINLNSDVDPDNGNVNAVGAFNGFARMGTPTVKDDVATYRYNGMWGGQFRGPPVPDDSDATGVDLLPPGASGTFGVAGTDTMGTEDTDDDVMRSYVGAFGARR